MYSFGPYKLDESTGLLTLNEQILLIPPKAATVLLVLVQAEGGVVTKEQLLEAAWPNAFVEEANVTQQIFLLRKLLRPDGGAGEPIQTIPRRGYRFSWPVEKQKSDGRVSGTASLASGELSGTADGGRPLSEALSTEWSAADGMGERAGFGLVETQAATSGPAKAQLAHRRWWMVAAAVVVVALATALTAKLVTAKSRPTGSRVAVLGFTNLSQRPGDVWLSSALREMFSTDLGGQPGLKVLPPESVERAEKDLRLTQLDGLSAHTLDQLGTNLECDEVLTGSYVMAGDKIRLDTHLVEARTGKVLFNYTATRGTNELLMLVEETGAALLPKFGVQKQLRGDEAAEKASVSGNPEAYRLFIEGIEHKRAYDGMAAVELLQRSIALDPDFALAHLQLSGAYTVLGWNQLASAEAHRAEALDGLLPSEQQLQVTAGAQAADHDFDAAAGTYQKLVTRYPDNTDYRLMMAAYTMYAGRLEDAIAELKPMLTGGAAREPLLYSHLSDAYAKVGDWTASLESAKKGAEISRERGQETMYERLLTSETQAMLYLRRLPEALDMTREALRIAREYGDDSGELRALNRLGQVETAMGDLPAARTHLEEAMRKEEATGESQREIHTLSALGAVLAKLNDQPEAIQMFLREQALARSHNEVQTIVGADLDVAREEVKMGHVKAGREDLQRVIQKAGKVGDAQSLGEAREALAGSASAK